MNENEKPQERPVTNEDINREAINDELARLAQKRGRKVPHEI